MYRKLKVYAGDKASARRASYGGADSRSFGERGWRERYPELALRKIEQYLGNWAPQTRHCPRVPAWPGSGKITVNGCTGKNYFPTEAGRVPVKLPLLTVEMTDRFDLLILANGGGRAGQAGAIKLPGIARALVEFNAESAWSPEESGSLIDTLIRREHERKQVRPCGCARKRFSVLQAVRGFSLWAGRGFLPAPRNYVVARILSRANLAFDRAWLSFGL